MNWQASMTWKVAKQRAELLFSIRDFFSARSVIEVETPLLSQGTVTDPHLDAFITKYSFLAEGEKQLYLQTSPEFAMKRLLASGYGCIYQLCKAFRHEEHGRHHNPEFTILEWYRVGFDHHQLMDEIETFLIAILACNNATRISYQQVFIDTLGVDPLLATKAECLALIKQENIYDAWLSDIDIDTLLQYIFCQLIEKKIGQASPCFVYGFPASQASLARINEHDQRIANRFECYYQGIELLNGFEELTDANTQLSRFNSDNQQRLALNYQEKPIDNRFIAALNNGLPACSGVALGIDRLLMLKLKTNSIDQVLTFPVERA